MRSARTRGLAGLWLAGAVILSTSCAPAGDSLGREAAAETTSTTNAARPEPEGRALRFKEVLASEDLVGGVPDDTLIAVARGVCDQLAAGTPEDDVLALVRPIATYAAGMSDAAVQGDDAARRYIDVARDTYC